MTRNNLARYTSGAFDRIQFIMNKRGLLVYILKNVCAKIVKRTIALIVTAIDSCKKPAEKSIARFTAFRFNAGIVMK